MLNGKSILITGGTGSFGKKFILDALKDYPDIKRVVIYSRDEFKQFEMSNLPCFKKHEEKLRYFIGDVRDAQRLERACEGVDIIIHAAALKQVPAAEYNPFECIKTNVLGAQNVIDAALSNNVEKVIALSTDKAAAPINLYGATKLCSDKLFVSANYMKGSRDVTFSVVRYGNVFGSRGSVVPFFLKKREEGFLPITDKEMTRFNISLDDAVSLVNRAIESSWGGETFVPKIPSYRITDVANAVAPDCKQTVVGIRPGEKVHEEMITLPDSINTLEFKDYFVIMPSYELWNFKEYLAKFDGEKVTEGFCYNSGTNGEWVSVEELRELIVKHIDPSFKVI